MFIHRHNFIARLCNLKIVTLNRIQTDLDPYYKESCLKIPMKTKIKR